MWRAGSGGQPGAPAMCTSMRTNHQFSSHGSLGHCRPPAAACGTTNCRCGVRGTTIKCWTVPYHTNHSDMPSHCTSCALLLLVALLLSPAASINTVPDPTSAPQVSHPFNASLRSGSDDVPEDDPRMQQVDLPEQVHVQYWGQGTILVSWVTDAAEFGPHASPRAPSRPAHVRYWPTHDPNAVTTVQARPERYFYTHTFAGAWNYSSPTIHHALLHGLTPNARYHYQVSGHRGTHTVWRAPMAVTVPPAVGDVSKDLVIGVMADVGQTYNSSDTMMHMLEDAPDLVVHVGDISYAGWWSCMQVHGCALDNNELADDYQSDGELDPWLTNTSQPVPKGIQRPSWGTFQV